MNVIIFGASITWGAWDKEGGWAQRIKSFADNKAISSSRDDYTAVYCLGVSGDNTESLLKRFDMEVQARVDEEEKTVILVEIGINDSQYNLSENKHRIPVQQYKNNLLKFAAKAKKYKASLIFVGLTPVDKRVDPIPWKKGFAYRTEFVEKYEKIIKEICVEQNIPFVEVMSKFTKRDYTSLLIDGLHPNTEGHKIIFEEVKKFLVQKNIL